MKVLTLHQPWASLVTLGAKRIETRSWKTEYRGPLAIHAAAVLPEYGRRAAYTEPFLSLLTQAGLLEVTETPFPLSGVGYRNHLPSGALLCTCRLADCVPTKGPKSANGSGPKYADWVHRLSVQERAFGNYEPGRFAWMLENIEPLPEPLPAKGFQRLWETDLL